MNFPAKYIPLVVVVASNAIPTINTKYTTRSEISLPNQSVRKLEVKAPMTALYQKESMIRSLLKRSSNVERRAYITQGAAEKAEG